MMLNAFPRAVGFPLQAIVNDRESAQRLIDQNNGAAPCFASCNSYPVVENGIPRTTLYEWMPFDLDSHDIAFSLADARRLVSFALSRDIPFIVRFSGSKGFHVYYRFAPLHIKLDPASARVVSAIQNWVIEQAGVKTADAHIIGDLRRIMRIPGTAWAKETGSAVIVNGNYCVTLTPHEVMTLEPDAITAIAKAPRPTPAGAAPDMPLQPITDFARMNEIDIDHYARRHANLAPQSFLPYHHVNEQLLQELMQKPCIVSALCTTHPPHVARFYLVARLNRLGFPSSWITGLVFDIAERYHWDNFNPAISLYQVENVLASDYKHPSCGTIKARGACMGASCSRYREGCA